MQFQQFGTAISIFLVGKTLEWSGYVTQQGSDVLAPNQPDTALTAIRWLLGPLPAAVLLTGVGIAALYPITRDVHNDILLQLHARRERS